MKPGIVVVDANIAFKCLRSGRGDLRSRIGPAHNPQLFTPRFLIVELFKHKERLQGAVGVDEEALLNALYALIARIEFVNEANIPVGTWVEAYRSPGRSISVTPPHWSHMK
jgi:predicted nucleic acid-binding protein